ncbi:MAG TPA: response regulator [Anditalea sp.]|nr:response regulator [Anditalea sp.]
MNKIRILIVEDEMILAANISLQLIKLGYEVTGIETRGEDAIHHAIDNNPDLILMDIRLKGRLDGIATAKAIQQKKAIPLIYLSANIDEETFIMAKETNPYAFIAKPFNMLDLERTIALVINQISKKPIKENLRESIEFLEDRIFIRNQNKLIKVMLSEIWFIEAERNYCKIVTSTHTYTIVCILGQLSEKLSNPNFIRIHRSFIVNISHLDAVAEGYLEIGHKIVPISKAYKNQLFKRIHKV